MNLTKEVEIRADLNSVWEAITDIDSMKEWNPSVVSDVPVDEMVSPGTGFKSTLTLIENGKTNTYDSEITAYGVGERVDLILKGGNLGDGPMEISHRLNSKGDITVLTQTVSWEPAGLMLKLLSPLITRMSAKKVEQDLLAIKDYAEAR